MIQLLTMVLPLLDKVLDRIPDPAAREKAREEFMEEVLAADRQAARDQVELNKVEAAHASVFVAGWRPAIGWVCAASLAIYYIPRFAIGTALWAWQVIQTGTFTELPEMGVNDLLGLLIGMLGLGTMRTVEKMQGVSTGLAGAPKYNVPAAPPRRKFNE